MKRLLLFLTVLLAFLLVGCMSPQEHQTNTAIVPESPDRCADGYEYVGYEYKYDSIFGFGICFIENEPMNYDQAYIDFNSAFENEFLRSEEIAALETLASDLPTIEEIYDSFGSVEIFYDFTESWAIYMELNGYITPSDYADIYGLEAHE